MNGFPFTLSASDISAARLKYHVSISDIEFRYEPATRLQTLSKSRHREDAPASRLRTLETSLRRKDRCTASLERTAALYLHRGFTLLHDLKPGPTGLQRAIKQGAEGPADDTKHGGTSLRNCDRKVPFHGLPLRGRTCNCSIRLPYRQG